MKQITRWLVFGCMYTVIMLSCKKQSDVYTIEPGRFNGGLQTSSSNLVLTKAKENDTAVAFNWSAADFGQKPVVQYSLQLDLPSDTSGVSAWKNAKNFTVENGSTIFRFTGKDLNNLLTGMGLSGGVSSNVAVRIKASVPQYNGAASSIAPVYSNTLAVKVTPYNTVLYVPGGYQGWSPGTAPVLNPVDGKPGLYEGYVYMAGTGTQYFKYTNAPDWDHTNYGDGGNGTFSTDGLAAGLSVADGGYYELTANLNNNTWTATKTTWGIIGDATPGGWNNDTQMTYDPVMQVWKVTANMKTAGSFKFRANNAWAIDFGIDNTGKLVYADNPFLGYTPGLNNLSVPQDGNYTITLDLHVSGKYTYSIVKN